MNNKSFYKSFLNKGQNIDTLHRTIVIEITRKCHHYSLDKNIMGCKHCFQNALNQQTISTDNLDKILTFATDYFPIIGIVGGEPFIEFDLIFNILKRFPNNIFNIFTSGEVLTNNYIDKLKEFNNIVLTISLHGTEKLHYKLTGNNTYSLITRNIAKLNSNKIKWIRKTVASKINIEYILTSEFENDSINLGCQSIDVCRYYPVGTRTKDDFKITKEQFLLLDEKLKLLTTKGLCIYQEGYSKNCKSLLCIDIEGYILPCPYTFFKEWNIENINSEKEFIDTLHNIKAFWEANQSEKYYCNLMDNYFN